jgi:4-hydroxybutyryl-CoA dehydratase/vinylacetyl-CoA-Delta-isomerase
MSPKHRNQINHETIRTGTDYINSLRGRELNVYLMGERISEPVDHPMIRPSINAMASTYDLALDDPALGSELSPFTGERVNRSCTSPRLQNRWCCRTRCNAGWVS